MFKTLSLIALLNFSSFGFASPLHEAAMMGNVVALKALIESGYNIRERDHNGFTPLDIAIQHNHEEACLFLLDCNISINEIEDEDIDEDSRSKKSDSSFSSSGSSFAGSGSLTRWLISETLNLDSHGIFVAISSGADINGTDHEGDTALHYAAAKGSLSILHILLTYHPNLNAHNYFIAGNNTPLHLAVLNGHADVVLALLTAGANPNRTNIHGLTVLDLAIQRGHQNIVMIIQAWQEYSLQSPEGSVCLSDGTQSSWIM